MDQPETLQSSGLTKVKYSKHLYLEMASITGKGLSGGSTVKKKAQLLGKGVGVGVMQLERKVGTPWIYSTIIC